MSPDEQVKFKDFSLAEKNKDSNSTNYQLTDEGVEEEKDS